MNNNGVLAQDTIYIIVIQPPGRALAVHDNIIYKHDKGSDPTPTHCHSPSSSNLESRSLQ